MTNQIKKIVIHTSGFLAGWLEWTTWLTDGRTGLKLFSPVMWKIVSATILFDRYVHLDI